MATSCWRLRIPLSAAVGLAFSLAPAAELVNPPAAPAPADAVRQPAALRDPFWPVGYAPAVTSLPPVVVVTNPATNSVAPPESVPVADDLMKRAFGLLRLGGIIKRRTNCFATVNGTMVAPGDTIPVVVDGNVVLFFVRSIDLKRVRIEPVLK